MLHRKSLPEDQAALVPPALQNGPSGGDDLMRTGSASLRCCILGVRANLSLIHLFMPLVGHVPPQSCLYFTALQARQTHAEHLRPAGTPVPSQGTSIDQEGKRT